MTIGEWTIGIREDTLGKVYVATNSEARVVSIKIIERNSETAAIVEDDIQVLYNLNRLCEDKNDEGRLQRLTDLMYPYGKKEYVSNVFGEVALIREPVVEMNFGQLTDIAKDRVGQQVCLVHDMENHADIFSDLLR